MNHLNDSDKLYLVDVHALQRFHLTFFGHYCILILISCHFFLWAERQVKDSRRSGLSFYYHPKLSLFTGAKLVITVHE